MAAKTAEDAALLREPKPGYSKPLVAACAVAAFLLGAAVATARPSLTTTSSLARPFPYDWNCKGAEAAGDNGPIEDSGLGIVVRGRDQKGTQETLKSGDTYYIDTGGVIQISVDPGSSQIYAFFFSPAIMMGSTLGNPKIANAANSVKLDTVPGTNETCGGPLHVGAPVVNDALGMQEEPVKGPIVVDYDVPPSPLAAGEPLTVMIFAGDGKMLYSSQYYVQVGDPPGKKKKGDGAARALVHVAAALAGLAALVVLA